MQLSARRAITSARFGSQRTLPMLHGTIMGDWAVGSGWLARAQTVLMELDDPEERGWVALDVGMFEPDRERKHVQFAAALTAARQAGAADLEISVLAYYGASLVHGGRIDDGMRMLDESLAAIAGHEVEDFCVIEEVFCQLFSACERVTDVARADQWISVGELLAERKGLPAVSAFCRTHYGGVLTAAGRWSEADVALTGAIQLWALGRRAGLQAGAIARLADLRDAAGTVRGGRPVARRPRLGIVRPRLPVRSPPLHSPAETSGVPQRFSMTR